VSQAVVHVLEAVQVQQQQGKGIVAPAGAVQGVPEPIDEQRPVRKPGQVVVQRRVAPLLLVVAALRDVEGHPDGARDLAARPAERLHAGLEDPSHPFHLEVHRLGLERAPVGGHGEGAGVVGGEVLEQAAADEVAAQGEPADPVPERRGDPERGVGGPEDGGHLPGQQAQARLAVAQRLGAAQPPPGQEGSVGKEARAWKSLEVHGCLPVQSGFFLVTSTLYEGRAWMNVSFDSAVSNSSHSAASTSK